MMKKNGRFLLLMALVLSLVMSSAVMFMGCKTPPEVKITDGIYDSALNGMKNFYRFRADKTFYGFFFDGGVKEAGTYEIKVADFKYVEAQDGEEKTAKKSITFSSYTGSTYEFALTDTAIYTGVAKLGGMAQYIKLEHKPTEEYDDSKEAAVPIYTFYNNNLVGDALTLFHNRTFEDYTSATMAEGTWALQADKSFKLTAGSNVYTLAISGKQATYVKGTDTLTIKNYISSGAVKGKIEATSKVNIGLPVDFYIELYDSYESKVFFEHAAIGGKIEVDEGTWSVSNVGVITLIPKAGGTFTSEFNNTDSVIEITYNENLVTNPMQAGSTMKVNAKLTFPMSKLAELL